MVVKRRSSNTRPPVHIQTHISGVFTLSLFGVLGFEPKDWGDPAHYRLLTQVPTSVSLAPPITGSSDQCLSGRGFLPLPCARLSRPQGLLGSSVAAHCGSHAHLTPPSCVLGNVSLSLSFQVPLCLLRLLPSRSASFNQALALFFCFCSSFSSELGLLKTNRKPLAGIAPLKQWTQGFFHLNHLEVGGRSAIAHGRKYGGKKKKKQNTLQVNFKMLSSHMC